MGAPLPILDAHVHQWDPLTSPRTTSPLARVLPAGPAQGRAGPALIDRVARLVFPRDLVRFVGRPDFVLRPYLPADLAADQGELASRVEGVVHVQAQWKARRSIELAGETRWLEALDPRGEVIRAIVGEACLDDPGLDALLDAHAAASTRFRGVRDSLAASPRRGVADFARGRALMTDPRWRAGYARLGERGLSFDAWLYHEQLDDLASLMRELPNTPTVLCHLGSPVGIGGPFGELGGPPGSTAAAQVRARWQAGIEAVAAAPGLRFKVSGLLMPISGFAFEHRPPQERPSVQEVVDRIGPLVEWFIDTVGIERCLFGSNFPMDKVSVDYVTVVAAMEQLVAGRDEGQRAAFFAGNARAFYRIDPPAAAD